MRGPARKPRPKAKAKAKPSVATKRKSAERKEAPGENDMYYKKGSFWLGAQRLRGINTFMDKHVLAELKAVRNLGQCPQAFLNTAAERTSYQFRDATPLTSYQKRLVGSRRGRYIHGQVKRVVDRQKRAAATAAVSAASAARNRPVSEAKSAPEAKVPSPQYEAKSKRAASAKATVAAPAMHPMTASVFRALAEQEVSILDAEKMVHWGRHRYGTAADVVTLASSKKTACVYELKTGHKDLREYDRPCYVLKLDAGEQHPRLVSAKGRALLQALLTRILLEKSYPQLKRVDAKVLHVVDAESVHVYALPKDLLALKPRLEALLASSTLRG